MGSTTAVVLAWISRSPPSPPSTVSSQSEYLLVVSQLWSRSSLQTQRAKISQDLRQRATSASSAPKLSGRKLCLPSQTLLPPPVRLMIQASPHLQAAKRSIAAALWQLDRRPSVSRSSLLMEAPTQLAAQRLSLNTWPVLPSRPLLQRQSHYFRLELKSLSRFQAQVTARPLHLHAILLVHKMLNSG